MRTYGLIGFPLGHSFSRRFFTEKFERENSKEVYLNFEIDQIGKLPAILAANPELAGLNVTIPYKEQVIPLIDQLDETAAAVGAVNTIKISREENRLVLAGFNSDVHGFTESLRPLLQPHHRKALVLGTGGAARAVTYSLERLHIGWLQVSRNPSSEKQISYSDIDATLLEEYPLIVNTTPVGTFPNTAECPRLPYASLTARNLLYDLVYNPAETLFLAQGKARGATVKNGYEMLELQALKSYEIWNR